MKKMCSSQFTKLTTIILLSFINLTCGPEHNVANDPIFENIRLVNIELAKVCDVLPLEKSFFNALVFNTVRLKKMINAAKIEHSIYEIATCCPFNINLMRDMYVLKSPHSLIAFFIGFLFTVKEQIQIEPAEVKTVLSGDFSLDTLVKHKDVKSVLYVLMSDLLDMTICTAHVSTMPAETKTESKYSILDYFNHANQKLFDSIKSSTPKDSVKTMLCLNSVETQNEVLYKPFSYLEIVHNNESLQNMLHRIESATKLTTNRYATKHNYVEMAKYDKVYLKGISFLYSYRNCIPIKNVEIFLSMSIKPHLAEFFKHILFQKRSELEHNFQQYHKLSLLYDMLDIINEKVIDETSKGELCNVIMRHLYLEHPIEPVDQTSSTCNEYRCNTSVTLGQFVTEIRIKFGNIVDILCFNCSDTQ